MKPPVALPIAMLIVLFHTRRHLRILAGFATASAVALLATVIATGAHSLGLWVGGMLRYSRDITQEPDISSLAGLYVRSLTADFRIGIGALAIVSACVLTAVMVRRLNRVQTRPEVAAGWLWLLWFLATPYAHFFDEILFTLPVLAFMGNNGELVSRRNQAIVLYMLFFSLIFIEWAPQGIQLLSLPLVVVTLALEIAGRGVRIVGNPFREAA
jgi:Glycosyltransferase family 87